MRTRRSQSTQSTTTDQEKQLLTLLDKVEALVSDPPSQFFTPMDEDSPVKTPMVSEKEPAKTNGVQQPKNNVLEPLNVVQAESPKTRIQSSQTDILPLKESYVNNR